MIDYGAIAAEVAEAYAEVGFTAQLVRRGAATGPEHSPVFEELTSYSVTLAQVEFSFAEQESGFVQTGDAKYALSADGLTIVPTTKDWIEIDGQKWSIEAVKVLAPGGQAIRYLLHVRRS